MQRWSAFASLTLLSVVTTPASASDSEVNGEDRTGRVLAEAGLGLVGGAMGVGVGYLAAGELVDADQGCIDACGVGRLGWAVVGGSVLGIVGTSLGAYAAAEWMGGDGSLGWTMFGSLSGAAVGVATAIVEVRDDAPGALIGVTLLVPPLVGAVLGYELSSTSRSDRVARAASLDILPARGGATFGFRGTF